MSIKKPSSKPTTSWCFKAVNYNISTHNLIFARQLKRFQISVYIMSYRKVNRLMQGFITWYISLLVQKKCENYYVELLYIRHRPYQYIWAENRLREAVILYFTLLFFILFSLQPLSLSLSPTTTRINLYEIFVQTTSMHDQINIYFFVMVY